MLGGDQEGTRRDLLQSAEFGPDAANPSQQPEIGARPESHDGEQRAARHGERRNGSDQVQAQIEIEQEIERDRPENEHGKGLMCVSRMRRSTA